MPYLLFLKMQQNLKLSSAANYRWRFLHIFSARKGNLTERIVGVIVSILLSVPSILGAIFYLYWQTYVMRADVILAGIQLGFIGLQLVFGIIAIITFARYGQIFNPFKTNEIFH